jgi:hypothetical protein
MKHLLCIENYQIINNTKYREDHRLATGWTAEGSEFESRRGKTFLLSSSRPVLRPIQPPIQWVPGALPPGVKMTGREAHHSPPTSAEIKNTWIYTSTSPYVLKAQCLIS